MTTSDWNPGPKYRAYLGKIQEILENGEERTVRDIYYALESRGFPTDLERESYNAQLERHRDDPDSHAHPEDIPVSEWLWEFEYRFVKRAVKKGRRSGYIDPRQIVDSSRAAETVVTAGYDDPSTFVENEVIEAHTKYYENFWKDQDSYVEVWLEKQSLASVFAPLCRKYNVRLEATRGDWSDSKVFEASQRIVPRLNEGKDVRILYFGDYNPSGYHAPVSILSTMEHYGISFNRSFPTSDDRRYYDVEHGLPASFDATDSESKESGSFNVERIALTTDQIENFDLPENPVPSSTDKDETIKSQFKKYVSAGRDTNVELNALKEYHRDFLEELLEDSITKHIDADAHDAVQERMTRRREQIQNAVSVDWDMLSE